MKVMIMLWGLAMVLNTGCAMSIGELSFKEALIANAKFTAWIVASGLFLYVLFILTGEC